MSRSGRPWHALSLLALTIGLCLVCAVSLQAQTTSASVAGSVKDAQGGVLPGATVTLTSASQGTETTAVSDALGNFYFPIVRPDTYTLKISLEGFSTIQGTKVVVNANDRVTAGNFTLQVGSLTESVTVTGQSPELQLRSGERAFTMESSAMQNVAVNGRSPFQLAMLVPGVVPNSDNPTEPGSYNVNGQRNNSNNMTVDGVANIDTGNNGTPMAQTNLDAISEFRILTSSYQAEFGRAVGGQIQVVTKSGTQNFSGPVTGTAGGRTGTPSRGPTTGTGTSRPRARATTRATRLAARCGSPACSTRTRRSSSSSGARNCSAARTRSASSGSPSPPNSNGWVTSRRASTTTATPTRTSRTTR